MAAKAECADIVEVALSTALNHGLNVIGIPQALATVLSETPKLQQRLASAAA